MFINIVNIMINLPTKLHNNSGLKNGIAPCFVLRANRFLVGILHNNGLRHTALSYAQNNYRVQQGFLQFTRKNRTFRFEKWYYLNR
jgi:hypothetical protein